MSERKLTSGWGIWLVAAGFLTLGMAMVFLALGAVGLVAIAVGMRVLIVIGEKAGEVVERKGTGSVGRVLARVFCWLVVAALVILWVEARSL